MQRKRLYPRSPSTARGPGALTVYFAGMDTLVCDYFTELTAGTGAVAATLAKYTA